MKMPEVISSEPIECDREPIHIPGQIQPHGVLLTLQEPDLKILQLSQNIDEFFGLSAETLLDKPLGCFLSPNQVRKIARYSQQENLEDINPFELKIRRSPKSDETEIGSFQKFHGILHRNKSNILILELEPYLHQGKNSLEFYHILQRFMHNIRQVKTLQELVKLLAIEVRKINTFDRVMVYKFDPTDQSGIVIAEDKENHLESYLGLRYPASDIPQKARTLYYENWLRMIPDINYQPIPIIPTYHPVTKEPLDLSYSVLRSVFGGHIEYLQNMVVFGSMSISLINENRLWGLIACHHYTPKYVDYKTRKACEFLGQFASIELLRQQELETIRYQVQVQSIHQELRQAFSEDVDFVEQVLERNQSQLLDLVCAQGAAIFLDDQLTLIGETPSQEEIQELLAWFVDQNPQEIFFTDSLCQFYPQAQKFSKKASGVAIASIFIKQKSHHIIWFRPEKIQTVNWAGASSNPISITENGEARYTPRKSFELWQEIIREQSQPWQPLEIEAALELRKILMQALLDASQAALERAAALEREATEAAIANRAKSQFLAKMSHELRTPLTAILGFTHLISRDHSLTETHKKHLNIISQSGEHLLSLINDVLEMSKIESGQVTLTENSFDLYRLLYSIRDMFAIKALNKGVELMLTIAPEVPQYVYGDEGKLRQILLNLVSNAVKFTPKGYISLQVWAKPKLIQTQDQTNFPSGQPTPTSPSQPWNFGFEVEDTGIGIAPDDLDLIFEAFKQTDQGRYLQGSGLGLSISRQFALLMGGDVTVESIQGQGSIFVCQVKLCVAEATTVFSPEETQLVIGLQPGQPSYRILVVEDVLETRQLLVNLIESVGLEVRDAQNGEEAIALCQEWHPHLIWMDIRMPVMDGYEATRQIRATPEGKETKIIALTASAFDQDRKASLNAGCDDFVAKPFTETIFFEKMSHFLGLKYVYAVTSPLQESPSESSLSRISLKQLTSHDLQDMGNEWIAEMHQAALLLDERRLHMLIARIPKEKKLAAQTLSNWVSNLQFESIIALTQL